MEETFDVRTTQILRSLHLESVHLKVGDTSSLIMYFKSLEN